MTPYPSGSASGVSSFVRAIEAQLRAAQDEPVVIEPTSVPGPPGLGNVVLGLLAALAVFRDRRSVTVVHAQQLHAQSVFAGLAARILAKRLVLTVHGRSPSPRGLRGLAFRLTERAALAVANEVIFVSADLQRQFGGVGRVIPNGVPVEGIRAALPERDLVRKELHLGSDFVLLFVGRVTEDKGLRTLLSAFEAVRDGGAAVRLLLVGPVDSGVRGEIDRVSSHSLAGTLFVLGPRDPPYRFFAAADAFVLPSHREGLPLSLLEAMAAGLPVIATRVGGIPEVVDGSTGILIPPRDVPALKMAILRLCGHREEAAAMGERARVRIEDSFAFGSVWDSYRAIYGGADERTK